MLKEINEKQVVILLSCTMIATKFQRLPALVANLFGRDGWLIMVIWLLIDGAILWLVLNSLLRIGNQNVYDNFRQRFGMIGQIFVAILLFLYFYFSCLTTYKGTHEFFANTLFDKLSWEIFSIIFIILLYVMIKGGINVIGRTSELLSFFIAFGLVFALILGISKTQFEKILPIADFDFKILKNTLKLVPWFGNYLIIVPLFGFIKIKKGNEKKFKKSLLLTYMLTGVVIIAYYIVFYCLNENLAQFQSNSMSAITQYTLIGLGIGRPDWFLVLFVFLSTIISTAFFAWAFLIALSKIFNFEVKIWAIIVTLILIYVGDIFIFKNIEIGIDFMQNIAAYFMLFVNLTIPFILLFFRKSKEKTHG